MAGDWIKIETCTPDKPEVLQLADFLGITPEHALGCLIRVWIWADQQSVDGNAIRVTADQLDRIARNANVTQGLCNVGWAKSYPQGYSLPNFGRHNGESAKKRALTAKRQAKFRNASVTLPTLPEKRRDISITNTSSNSNPASAQPARKPDELNSTSTPKAAAHSPEKARQAIQEAAQARETASPMPDHIRGILKALKPAG